MLMNAQWGRIYREGAGVGQLVSFGVEMIQPAVHRGRSSEVLGKKRGGKVGNLKQTLGNWAKRSINNFGTFKTRLNTERKKSGRGS